MKEHNRIRLTKITARFAQQSAREQSEAERAAERDARFLAAFTRTRDEALVPVMKEVGAALEEAGHGYRVAQGTATPAYAVELQVLIKGRAGYKDTIRFFVKKDANSGFQVIGEVELKRSAVELTRFEAPEELTRDVAEQLIVDAVEQMFASNEGTRGAAP